VTAGVQLHGQDGPAEHLDLDVWRRTLDVNLTGAFLAVKHALPLLRAAAPSSIVMCGSPTGITMCGRGYDAYSASKGGMMALARALAADYAAEGIRVNVVVPGTTATPLIADLLADERTHADLVAGAPLGRLGTSEDLTGIAVFLASDESAYATGATFAAIHTCTRCSRPSPPAPRTASPPSSCCARTASASSHSTWPGSRCPPIPRSSPGRWSTPSTACCTTHRPTRNVLATGTSSGVAYAAWILTICSSSAASSSCRRLADTRRACQSSGAGEWEMSG